MGDNMYVLRKYIGFLIAMGVIIVIFLSVWKLQQPPLEKVQTLNGVPILTYHKVNPDPQTGGLGLRVRPADFDWEMHYLKINGYQSVSLGAVVDHFTKGGKLPDKPIVITFDDGYRDNYYYAYPILKKYDYTATIFVTTGTVGGINEFDYQARIQPKNKMLAWNQIKEMSNNGITIGAHTLDHVRLTKISQAAARRQILESKKVLEKELGKEINYFSYPYGDCNQSIAEIVKESGYQAATTTRPGLVKFPMNPFLLNRIGLTGHFDHQTFVDELHKY
jgi:peptidoglycan/xylan/chitin deacetylase (PgdA/CDA1 family)